MSIERARTYLQQLDGGLEQRIMEFEVSSATVELAASAVGCEPARIAKTLSFIRKGADGERSAFLVVCAGDARINNQKFKACFHTKPKMPAASELEELVGHEIGGVCPFGAREGVQTYLDESLQRFTTVYPACGSSNSAIELTCEELERSCNCGGWVDVCTIPDSRV